jgi:Transglycosylase SLT domain/SPOR domain
MSCCSSFARFLLIGTLVLALFTKFATGQDSPAENAAAPLPRNSETVKQAICRLIDSAAKSHALPADFLTRLIWAESSFRAAVVSPAGAQGIAQFMPGTAAERGLANPFDPEIAIPAAANLLADLKTRFGNLGLAAAAYNAGPRRVDEWLAKTGGLPAETRTYVYRITGRSADAWAAEAANSNEDERGAPQNCMTTTALFRVPDRPAEEPQTIPVAAWGVQLAGNFSKERALASYARARNRFASIIADGDPMIIGTRLRSRGTRAFYRVRVPAPTRLAATQLCDRLHRAGGACVVLRN